MATLLQRSHGRLGMFRLPGMGVAFGLALALGFALGGGACFIEPAPPASFRFDCSSDSECAPTEVCAQGLCQQQCGGETDEDCSQASACLNGYCSSPCLLADAQCSSPQTCVALAFPGDDPPTTGVCIVPCSDENPCADGQLCYDELGVCLTACLTTDDCGKGEECLDGVGICIPSF